MTLLQFFLFCTHTLTAFCCIIAVTPVLQCVDVFSASAKQSSCTMYWTPQSLQPSAMHAVEAQLIALPTPNSTTGQCHPAAYFSE